MASEGNQRCVNHRQPIWESYAFDSLMALSQVPKSQLLSRFSKSVRDSPKQVVPFGFPSTQAQQEYARAKPVWCPWNSGHCGASEGFILEIPSCLWINGRFLSTWGGVFSMHPLSFLFQRHIRMRGLAGFWQLSESSKSEVRHGLRLSFWYT